MPRSAPPWSTSRATVDCVSKSPAQLHLVQASSTTVVPHRYAPSWWTLCWAVIGSTHHSTFMTPTFRATATAYMSRASTLVATCKCTKSVEQFIRLPLLRLYASSWWSLGLCLGLQHHHRTCFKSHSGGLQEQSLSTLNLGQVHEERRCGERFCATFALLLCCTWQLL